MGAAVNWRKIVISPTIRVPGEQTDKGSWGKPPFYSASTAFTLLEFSLIESDLTLDSFLQCFDLAIPRPFDWTSYLTKAPIASAGFMEGVEDLPVQVREP